jgi:hypothetical protein
VVGASTLRRVARTPYGLLGLNLPELGFWELLGLTPEELRENRPRWGITSAAQERGAARPALALGATTPTRPAHGVW